MISVVIPLYNKERSIKNTIDSVLAQNYLPSEIIVVNDGSTDRSLEVVQDLQSRLIRIIDKKNEGVSKARNVGIGSAQYEWIALLDADDIWLPNHLETLVDLVSQFPENQFFTTSFSVNHATAESEKNKGYLKGYLIDNYYDAFNKQSFIIHSSTAFFKTKSLQNCKGFDEQLHCGEDIEFWLRLFNNYKLVKSDQITSIYKMDSENRALGRNIPFENDFASKINLERKDGLERKYLKDYLFSKIKTYLYKKEFNNLLHLIQKHNFQLLK